MHGPPGIGDTILIIAFILYLIPTLAVLISSHFIHKYAQRYSEQLEQGIDHLRKLRAEIANAAEPLRREVPPAAQSPPQVLPPPPRPPAPATPAAPPKEKPWSQFPPEAPPPGPGDLR